MGRLSYQSQVTNTSSQDSIQDGLSPDMSDYDHSSELDNDPREIHIPKTSSSLGEDEGERRERENGRGSVGCCEHKLRLRRFTIIKRHISPSPRACPAAKIEMDSVPSMQQRGTARRGNATRCEPSLRVLDTKVLTVNSSYSLE